LAQGALCLWGEEGCGKSVLAQALVKNLQTEGYLVAITEPATPKQMLTSIAEQFALNPYNLEGK
jgi:MoxR-like ATPase